MRIIHKTFLLIFKPYTNRIKLGEGGLVVFNITHSLMAEEWSYKVLFSGILSFFVMCALYGFNDFKDAEEDMVNPKKDLGFIELILDNKGLFFVILSFIQILTIIASYFYFGIEISLFLISLYFTNYLYSKKLKSIPIADIIIVCLWGGLYVCLVGSFNWKLMTIAGLMTGVAHFFQVITDKDSDERNRIITSAKFKGVWAKLLLFILCSLLFGVLAFVDGWQLGFISLIPFFVYFFSKNVVFSWYISRFIFFVLWIVTLFYIYGSK